MMASEYIAYIDEAGDEGFGKLRNPGKTGQSKWLALGAAITSRQNDRFMPSWRDEVMGLFPNKRRRDLHFRYLNHTQKVATCKILAEKPIGICVVASNKETILDSDKMAEFKAKGHLYNYLVRFLLERVTQACAKAAVRDGNGQARLTVTFSRRSGTDYQVMRDYLCLMRDGKEVIRPKRSIDWSVLNPEEIRVENHAVRAGLQIADVLTSATSNALEPDQYGSVESRYALILKNNFIRHNSQILDCGLTLIPPFNRNPLNDEQREFLLTLNKKDRPPIPDAHR